MADSGAVLSTVAAVVEALGGNDAVYRQFGISPQKLSNYRAEGRFPARLYLKFSAALARVGRKADPDLWNQEPPAARPARRARA